MADDDPPTNADLDQVWYNGEVNWETGLIGFTPAITSVPESPPPGTLTEFLLARIAKDEMIAQAASTEDALRPYGDPEIELVPIENWGDLAREYLGGQFGDQAARWHPLRILAECEAKRRIVELHDRSHECSVYDHHGEIDNCSWEPGGDCSTLRLLAFPYSDHPDFQPGWRL
jgi:hypothetical protein